jgi:hypothetical protein
MRVTVCFCDGERMTGTSEAVTLSKLGFPLVPELGNNQLVWVSLVWVKYVMLLDPVEGVRGGADPREAEGLPKVAIHFVDGETLRTYRDDHWGPDGEGFKARIWDPERGVLVPVLVSPHALKAIFFVRQWDSRTELERLADQSRGDWAFRPSARTNVQTT